MNIGDSVVPVSRRRKTKTAFFKVKKILPGGRMEISPDYGGPDLRKQIFVVDCTSYRPA